MNLYDKKLSNPYSTGSGGAYFESRVQSAFVALMLAKGVCPCLPCWPIYQVKFQGKYSGYNTDDLIVFTRDGINGRTAKLIAQIKHSPRITKSDANCAASIRSAWEDFNNPKVFDQRYDKLALITGPLSAIDSYDVRDMLEIARAAKDKDDFFDKIKRAKFSSKKKQDKLNVFQHHIARANGGNLPCPESIYQFLRSFHLLGYDLDIKAGVSVSLLQSLIGIASNDDVEKVWLKILNEVQSWNPRAGVITLDNLPQDLLDCFQIKIAPRIPAIPTTPIGETIAAALLGAWDENSNGDKQVIEEFTGMAFSEWKDKIRQAWLANS